MITIGVDAHKRLHVAVALDAQGQEVSDWQGPNTPRGWRELGTWARSQGAVQFGIEGAWGHGRGLAQALVAQGARVYEINPRWTAAGRRRARRPGKSDRLDARAIATVLREQGTTLPRVEAEDDTAVLDLLTLERESALAEATRLRNQLHAQLLQLDPEYHHHLPALRSQAGVAAALVYTVDDDNALRRERAAVVRRLATRLALALQQARGIAARIRTLAAGRFEPLTRLCGVNLLTAGAIAGMLGPGQRFATDAELAAYAGVAPLEASSAGAVRHRLNRTGKRRLNAVFYRIALTQAHYSPLARAYLDRRMREGKTRREAVRALKRYLVRAVFRLWRECGCVEAVLPAAAS